MRIGITINFHPSKLQYEMPLVLQTVCCYISSEAAGGNVKLITHGSERVKLFCVPM